MFVYRIYELEKAGKDFPADIDAAAALNKAQRLAVDCVVELWRGSNLLATFRSKEEPLS